MFYVMAHKAFDDGVVPKNGYKVLWMSTEEAPKEGYIWDRDSQDNIAEKNHHYSETTGCYWVWKNGNEKTDDVVGIVHYRSFFYCGIMKLSYRMAQKILHRYDIILPVKRSFMPRTVEEQYAHYHLARDIQKTKEILQRSCPEYLPAFEKVMKSQSLWTRNMMVTHKKTFDEYCAWLFPVLEETERETDYSEYDGTYQERLQGFLAERLMNVWIVAHKDRLKCKILPVYMQDRAMIVNVLKTMRNRINNCRDAIENHMFGLKRNCAK